MQCTRVSEQLPERRNQTVSKAVRGRAGLRGGPRPGVGGWEGCVPQRRGDAGVGGGVGGTRAAGFVGAVVAPGCGGEGVGKALAGRGCPEWGSRTPARWATLGTPGPWAGWGAGKGGRTREGGPGGAGREQLRRPPGSGGAVRRAMRDVRDVWQALRRLFCGPVGFRERRLLPSNHSTVSGGGMHLCKAGPRFGADARRAEATCVEDHHAGGSPR